MGVQSMDQKNPTSNFNSVGVHESKFDKVVMPNNAKFGLAGNMPNNAKQGGFSLVVLH